MTSVNEQQDCHHGHEGHASASTTFSNGEILGERRWRWLGLSCITKDAPAQPVWTAHAGVLSGLPICRPLVHDATQVIRSATVG